jgi:hypothetical protein
MKGYTISAKCGRCKQSFYYVRDNPHGRKRGYCDTCDPKVKIQSNRDRQAAYKKRQRQLRETTTKQTDDSPPRPVSIGMARDTEPYTPTTPAGGMYATTPEPHRTASRARVGLPSATLTPMRHNHGGETHHERR